MTSFETHESQPDGEPADPVQEYILSHPASNTITAELAKVLLSHDSTAEERNSAIVDAVASIETRYRRLGTFLLDNQ